MTLLAGMPRIWRITAVAAVLMGPALPAPAYSQSEVRILVNDEPITSGDIKNRTQMLRVFSKGKQGEKDAIEQLIDEKLMLQEAVKRKMTVSDADVDQEIKSRAEQLHMTAEQFNVAIRHAGFDPSTFKNFLRANLSWTQMVRARFHATVKVTDQDVTAALARRTAPKPGDDASKPAAPPTAFEYRLQQILFVVPAGAKAGLEAQRKTQAAAFRSRFKDCGTSLEATTALTDVVVKPPVRRDETALPDDLKKELATLNVGGITQPMRVAEGFQLLGVCAKTEVPGTTAVTEQVRGELSSERGKLLARRYLRDLRSDAVIEYK
jgi:peptidyl-prolyl cis-trans isomerase SurA